MQVDRTRESIELTVVERWTGLARPWRVRRIHHDVIPSAIAHRAIKEKAYEQIAVQWHYFLFAIVLSIVLVHSVFRPLLTEELPVILRVVIAPTPAVIGVAIMWFRFSYLKFVAMKLWIEKSSANIEDEVGGA